MYYLVGFVFIKPLHYSYFSIMIRFAAQCLQNSFHAAFCGGIFDGSVYLPPLVVSNIAAQVNIVVIFFG